MPPTLTASASPTATGTTKDCKAWYLAVGNDDCASIALAFGTFSESGKSFPKQHQHHARPITQLTQPPLPPRFHLLEPQRPHRLQQPAPRHLLLRRHAQHAQHAHRARTHNPGRRELQAHPERPHGGLHALLAGLAGRHVRVDRVGGTDLGVGPARLEPGAGRGRLRGARARLLRVCVDGPRDHEPGVDRHAAGGWQRADQDHDDDDEQAARELRLFHGDGGAGRAGHDAVAGYSGDGGRLCAVLFPWTRCRGSVLL